MDRSVHQADQEDRVELIEPLCLAFRTGEPYGSTLDMMGPFTVAVNDAYESNFLYSEIGVPWAKTSGSFDTRIYTALPVRFEADLAVPVV